MQISYPADKPATYTYKRFTLWGLRFLRRKVRLNDVCSHPPKTSHFFGFISFTRCLLFPVHFRLVEANIFSSFRQHLFGTVSRLMYFTSFESPKAWPTSCEFPYLNVRGSFLLKAVLTRKIFLADNHTSASERPDLTFWQACSMGEFGVRQDDEFCLS